MGSENSKQDILKKSDSPYNQRQGRKLPDNFFDDDESSNHDIKKKSDSSYNRRAPPGNIYDEYENEYENEFNFDEIKKEESDDNEFFNFNKIREKEREEISNDNESEIRHKNESSEKKITKKSKNKKNSSSKSLKFIYGISEIEGINLSSPDIEKKFQDINIIDLSKKLGQGAFGNVYGGINILTNNKFAVKIINLKKLNNSIRKELIPIQLHNYNLSEIFHVSLEGNNFNKNLVLYMPLYEGGDLFDLLNQFKFSDGLPENLCRGLFIQIIEGVRYLHHFGIAHRDLKPENIMLRTPFIEGEMPNLVIIDFGFSIQWNPVTEKRHMDQESSGTPEFASPELYKNTRRLSTAPDIWALGIILFTMGSGGKPFYGDSETMIYNILYENYYYPCGNINKDQMNIANTPCNAMLLNLLKNLLNKDWTKRATIDEIFDYSWFKRIIN